MQEEAGRSGERADSMWMKIVKSLLCSTVIACRCSCVFSDNATASLYERQWRTEKIWALGEVDGLKTFSLSNKYISNTYWCDNKIWCCLFGLVFSAFNACPCVVCLWCTIVSIVRQEQRAGRDCFEFLPLNELNLGFIDCLMENTETERALKG